MKLIELRRPSLLAILEDCTMLSDDAAWVYGQKLFNDYLHQNNQELQEWMHRRDVECLMCKKQNIDNGLGCDSCWKNECQMMELSDKFYRLAQKSVHLLSSEEVSIMRQEYIDVME